MFNFHFLKNGSNHFHQILWVYCTFELQQYGTVGFSRKKNPYPSPNVAPKPTDQSSSNSIFGALLQLTPALPFHFQHIPKIKGSSHKKQENEPSNIGILQTWSIVFVSMLRIISAGETAKRVLLSVYFLWHTQKFTSWKEKRHIYLLKSWIKKSLY